MKISVIASFLFALLSTCAAAQDNVLNLESTIAGSQEQPKVIYIVPWQGTPPAPGLSASVIDHIIQRELLGPIDREVFQRQVHYQSELQTRHEATAK